MYHMRTYTGGSLLYLHYILMVYVQEIVVMALYKCRTFIEYVLEYVTFIEYVTLYDVFERFLVDVLMTKLKTNKHCFCEHNVCDTEFKIL